MTGNVALDVVIGLVFIYLLYSLYATVIMELISSFFGLRSKNLCYALSRMLKDEKKYDNKFKELLARLGTTFSRTWGRALNMKNPSLYKSFFEQSSIKYLCSGGLGNRPSYLSSENFFKGLMDSIKTDDPDLSKMAAFENGLSKLPPKSDTRIFLQSLLDDAHNDPIKFRILVENWFNNTMERSSGWFKQTTQALLILVGFFLAVTFNVDTLAIIKKLSKDEHARDELVKMSSNFIEKNAGLLSSLKDTATEVNKRLDSLQAIRSSLNEDISNSQSLLSSGWNISDSILLKQTKDSTLSNDSVQIQIENGYVTIHKSVDAEIIKRSVDNEVKNSYVHIHTFSYKFKYVLRLKYFLGYLLTVLALSLGAPFWFDLLNKLVKLRTSKSVPEASDDGKPSSTDSNRTILNRVG